MAEAAYLYGWRPDEILDMRATLFFRVINHGRKIYNRERNLLLRDLCDIGVIPHHFQNYKASKEHFTAMAFPRKSVALPVDDINTARIAAAMFRAGGGRIN